MVGDKTFEPREFAFFYRIGHGTGKNTGYAVPHRPIAAHLRHKSVIITSRTLFTIMRIITYNNARRFRSLGIEFGFSQDIRLPRSFGECRKSKRNFCWGFNWYDANGKALYPTINWTLFVSFCRLSATRNPYIVIVVVVPRAERRASGTTPLSLVYTWRKNISTLIAQRKICSHLQKAVGAAYVIFTLIFVFWPAWLLWHHWVLYALLLLP